MDSHFHQEIGLMVYRLSHFVSSPRNKYIVKHNFNRSYNIEGKKLNFKRTHSINLKIAHLSTQSIVKYLNFFLIYLNTMILISLQYLKHGLLIVIVQKIFLFLIIMY